MRTKFTCKEEGGVQKREKKRKLTFEKQNSRWRAEPGGSGHIRRKLDWENES